MEQPEQRPLFVIVMGVSGTGKSTLGAALAAALDMPYVEGDDLHPQANVDKMARGEPLNDADREPWLQLIRKTALGVLSEAKSKGVVISCSALKVYYREILRGNVTPPAVPKEISRSEVEVVEDVNAAEDKQHAEDTSPPTDLAPETPGPAQNTSTPTDFVFIDGPKDVLQERMEKRPGHFMKASMLDSQLATLESPVGEEGVVVVSVLDSTEDQVQIALRGLNLKGPQ